MAKYLFKVFDTLDNRQTAQVITTVDNMLETIEILSKLGLVKGFILDDEEKEFEK